MVILDLDDLRTREYCVNVRMQLTETGKNLEKEKFVTIRVYYNSEKAYVDTFKNVSGYTSSDDGRCVIRFFDGNWIILHEVREIELVQL